VEASTVGLTFTSEPLNTQPRWLGEKRGASEPSLISRVTAKRLNAVGGRYNRVLSAKPSVAVSISPTVAVILGNDAFDFFFVGSEQSPLQVVLIRHERSRPLINVPEDLVGQSHFPSGAMRKILAIAFQRLSFGHGNL
jgi:hypothetical protein